jgi:phosphoribosyl 1,2-cyclic phosphodiesterase
MDAKGLDPGSLDAIIVSHEHADHIHGVGVLSRRFKMAVHISDATLRASQKTLGRLAAVHPFTCGNAFSIGTFVVHPFSVSHDAADPAGFTIRSGTRKLGVATDLGVVTGLVQNHLQDCDILILEANHDPRMLIDGPYPWPLKQRILGRSGHLSNEDTARLLEALLHDRLGHVVLAHLSEENNTPEKAKQTIEPLLGGNGVRLHVASQAHGSTVLIVNR